MGGRTQVLLARLDGLRRRGAGGLEELRAAFQAATHLLEQYFPDYLDLELRLPAYWAACELTLADDIAAARSVWEAALKTPLGRYACHPPTPDPLTPNSTLSPHACQAINLQQSPP